MSSEYTRNTLHKFQRAMENNFRRILPKGTDPARACFFWVAAAARVRSLFPALHIVPQAGSASWRAVSEAADDGTSPTNYSYVFEPSEAAYRQLKTSSLLPEIHCWLAIRTGGEWFIVDPTTRHVKELAAVNGLVWSTPELPKTLCVPPTELPEGCLYQPDLRATEMIAEKVVFFLRSR